MAPVLPFICEEIYQGLTQQEDKSIHYEEGYEAFTTLDFRWVTFLV